MKILYFLNNLLLLFLNVSILFYVMYCIHIKHNVINVKYVLFKLKISKFFHLPAKL